MRFLRFGAASHKGQIRADNQDSYFAGRLEIDGDGINFLAVADGIGGYLGGDTASKMAVDMSVSYLTEKLALKREDAVLFWPPVLKELAFYLNDRILEAAQSDPRYDSMGTTLTSVVETDSLLFMLHVGDSRFYHCNGQEIFQISGDHSWAGELLRSGKITASEAKNHPNRNILTQSLGYPGKLNPEIRVLELCPETSLLLCSDGLYNLVDDKEIMDFLLKMEDPQKTAEELVNLANLRGGEDNITVVTAKYAQAGDEL